MHSDTIQYNLAYHGYNTTQYCTTDPGLLTTGYNIIGDHAIAQWLRLRQPSMMLCGEWFLMILSSFPLLLSGWPLTLQVIIYLSISPDRHHILSKQLRSTSRSSNYGCAVNEELLLDKADDHLRGGQVLYYVITTLLLSTF